VIVNGVVLQRCSRTPFVFSTCATKDENHFLWECSDCFCASQNLFLMLSGKPIA